MVGQPDVLRLSLLALPLKQATLDRILFASGDHSLVGLVGWGDPHATGPNPLKTLAGVGVPRVFR
jgi:hypothetical protein